MNRNKIRVRIFHIDKYTPKNINEIYFHKEIYELLERMSKDESIPHIIFHGVKGTGKKTMIKIFLEMLFDKSVNNIYEVDYKVTGSSNKVNFEWGFYDTSKFPEPKVE